MLQTIEQERLRLARWKHTDDCRKHQEEVYFPWLERWPHHCSVCAGAGQFYDYGDLYTPPSSDPCECTMAGFCARCGAGTLNEDAEGPCLACGWNYDDSMPEPCICPDEY